MHIFDATSLSPRWHLIVIPHCADSRKEKKIMARKKKKPQYERKRRRLNITLSDHAHDFLKNRVTNASRFIEHLIEDAEMGIAGAFATVSAIRDAANRTRTCDMLVNSQPLYQLSYGGTRISAL